MTVLDETGHPLRLGAPCWLGRVLVRVMALPDVVEVERDDPDGPCAELRVRDVRDGREEMLAVFVRDGSAVCPDVRCGVGR